MAETNGSEWEARLRALEQMRDEFRRDVKDLLTAQVIQKARIDDLLKLSALQRQNLEKESEERKAKDAALDERVADVVSAVGELIRRIPPENLQHP